MPHMVGKYFFTDIVTGRLLYTDLAEMLATGGVHGKQAQIHEVQLVYKSPYETNGVASRRRMFDIVAEAYAHKRTKVSLNNNALPGNAGLTAKNSPDPEGNNYDGGRADVRLGIGGDGEIYVLSKQDGMIRKLVSVVTPPPAKR